MKKFLGLFAIIIFCAIFLYSYVHSGKNTYNDSRKSVYVKSGETGFTLVRNGQPFKIRGANGKKYFSALSAIGGNTIRVYDTIDLKSALDRAHANHLAVIVDIPLPKYSKTYNFYAEEENVKQIKQNVQKLVNTYKSHPAVLIWNLGNELDYPITLTKNNFIEAYNELIDLIHQEDPDHPVGTTLIPSQSQTLGIHLHSYNIDVIGFNAFGNLKRIRPLMKKIAYIKPPLPYYISEYGGNGPWEEKMTPWQVPIEQTSTKKGEHYIEQFNRYVGNDKNSMGDLAFFWGQKQEHTHTWFSIFDGNGRKSEVYHSLKLLWGNPSVEDSIPPQLKYMLLDDKGAQDRLVFTANESKNARVLMESEIEGEIDTTFTYKWEIYTEGWNYDQTEKEEKPNILQSTEEASHLKSFTFKVPNKEGPYRIFVYVYDKKGNFATTNVPFYVLKK